MSFRPKYAIKARRTLRHLDKNFGLAHDLDHFADVACRLLKQAQLLSEHLDLLVEGISLGFESSQVRRSAVDELLASLYLALVVRFGSPGCWRCGHSRLRKQHRHVERL